MPISKVLVANRGEIAVRIIRAARDLGISSVAVYADQDIDALFTGLADEAYALEGTTPADTYLDPAKLLAIAARSAVDAVHPGYGFLAENAAFARAVITAGLTWIGPPPEAIEALGDKVMARAIARAVGAPLIPGSEGPVADADEVVAFADAHGLPVAIKAAFGGGGRGLRVARTRDEIPDLFAAATREAVAAFGRGECFVEAYLDRPRHVETQCLADAYGSVVVVSTRDCSLQRRHQKLLEEAPAPFLTPEQDDNLRAASKRILAAVGYVGAGTCEFLLSESGQLAFLEVNTRLQVEHPVTEEATGIDLVTEMFRIANAEPLGYADPPRLRHAIEFRINAEDPGRGFPPAPGRLVTWQPPTGPGVRVDEGYRAGMEVPGAFDSLVAKIVVSGADRRQALARARRALDETVLEGMPSLLPFHRAVLDEPAFIAAEGRLGVHTRWVETEFAVDLTPQGTAAPQPPAARRTISVEVDGKRFEVRLPAEAPPASAQRTRRERAVHAPVAVAATALTSPMQGTIIAVSVAEDDQVAAGQVVVVLEAMKMEQPIVAHRAGRIRSLAAQPGNSVTAGSVLCEIVDA